MSWVRTPLAAPILPSPSRSLFQPILLAAGLLPTLREVCLLRAAQPKVAAAPVLAAAPPNLFAGTSGWAYASWKPGFYPPSTPARRFLDVYATQLNSVEVNYTFRKLPSTPQIKAWLDSTPSGFLFSFKAPQRITHFQRLRESRATLAELLKTLRPFRSAGKLGPILFQLPPNFKADHDRLSAFLKLPAIARSSSLQLAFEFRHASWFTPQTYDLLHQHNAALCVAESDALATPEIRTAGFACYRLRKPGGYTSARLRSFAANFLACTAQGPVFAYFMHEQEPTGALNARALLKSANALARKNHGSRVQ
jgi:uncharacterized protein YecE (DUF72 family)